MHTCQGGFATCPLTAKACGGETVTVEVSPWMSASTNIDSKGAYRG